MLARFVRPNAHLVKPKLDDGEDLIFQGTVTFTRGLIGARWGRLFLTTRRIIWNQTSTSGWPFKPLSGQLNISEIADVDKGTLFDFIGGGRRLRLKLKNGKSKCLWDSEGKLDGWIKEIQQALAKADTAED